MIRSGSTWSFNVALEVFRAQNRAVVGTHTDSLRKTLVELGDFPADLVFKSHDLDDLSMKMLLAGQAKAIYTHRDPLDAIASAMAIFNLRFDEAFELMAASIRTLEQLVEARVGLLISYEELMTDPTAGVGRMAQYLAHPLTGLAIQAITDRTGRDKMKQLSDNFDQLPAERVCQAPGNWAYDRETLLHRNHIQDSRSGKGCEVLRLEQVRRVHSAFGDVLERVRPEYSRPRKSPGWQGDWPVSLCASG